MNSDSQKQSKFSAAQRRALLANILSKKAAEVRKVPASFAQQRLWFLHQLNPNTPVFNISKSVRFEGDLDVAALGRAFNALLARHESLRTNFDLIDGQAVQVISPSRELEIRTIDLRALSPSERELELQRLGSEATRRVFDLARDKLLCVDLYWLENEVHVLWLTIHHIISDGWSMSVLFRDLSLLYEAFVNGQPSTLVDLPIQYADFAVWQRGWLTGETLEKEIDYWRNQLAGASGVLNLPTDKPRPLVQSFNGNYHSLLLHSRLKNGLATLSRRSSTTMFMTLLAAFEVLLFRYTNQDDILVGTPIANRTSRDTEDLIGLFVNTLVMRTDLSGNPTFSELLQQVREVALQAYEHQDLPFEKLVEELNPERNLSYATLFQVFFTVQNQPKTTLVLSGLRAEEITHPGNTSKFDLSLYVGEIEEGLRLTFEYNTDVFNTTTIARMGRHLESILEAIISNPNQRVGELPLLDNANRQQVLIEEARRYNDYPQSCIHELFEKQAERTPDARALRFEDQEISFGELNTRTNQLAHFLVKRGVESESRIAVCMDRSIHAIVALLGILKAGAAYVPVDPSYPAERVAFLLQDSGASLVLTTDSLLQTLPIPAGEAICIDTRWPEIARESTSAMALRANPENAAYVIYTSGSTGQPKGSLSPHYASVNRFHWMWKTYPFDADEVCCHKTSLSFVDSVAEIFGPLLQGIPLVIIPDEVVRDPRRLIQRLSAGGVTRIVVVPSLLRLILEQDADLGKKLPRLNHWICSGEELPLSLVHSFKEKFPEAVLINLYGSSEVAADVTYHEIKDSTATSIPIGRTIDNVAAYILDGRFKPVPENVCGELYIAGAALSRCYLHHPELTAQAFLPNPFSSESGARMFRTGDLARYQEDGNIHFLGRSDDQVKIRGFRVELGEIEAALKSHVSIKDVAVRLKQYSQDDQRLLAYIVPNSNLRSEETDSLAVELRSFLRTKLPEYMIPKAFLLLDQLPLTPNGKIDRRSLPEPDSSRPQLEEARIAPRDHFEERLAKIWKNLLGLESIGVRDNFFDLGGHSLLAVRLVSEMEAELGQRIPLVSFFEGATIEYLANLLRQDVRAISWPTLIEIQTGGLKPPLFCVSAPNVNALGYIRLGRYLGSDQPMFGLQAQYPEDLDGEHSREAVEELATKYLEALRTIRPVGPYQFLGLCRGAHIALEMAWRLEREGQEVAFFGVIDTWVLENTYNRFLYLEHYASRLRWFLRAGFHEQLSFLTHKVSSRQRKADGVRGVSTHENNRPPHPMNTYFPGPDFVPKTIKSRIAVFRGPKQPHNRIRDRELGWGKLTLAGVDVHIIPGRHGTFLTEPDVRRFSQELKPHLLTEAAN